jgi:hypothetical protein
MNQILFYQHNEVKLLAYRHVASCADVRPHSIWSSIFGYLLTNNFFGKLVHNLAVLLLIIIPHCYSLLYITLLELDIARQDYY